jgi:hypothetical protein
MDHIVQYYIFWDIAPCSPDYLLHSGFLLGRFSTLKMEVIRSSETPVHMQTTRRYTSIPENGNYSCENPKSYIQVLYNLFGVRQSQLYFSNVFYHYSNSIVLVIEN